MKKPINFILAGVGGQGTILASDVLVNLGLAAGMQAKQAEVHGMSQRGGNVTSHVRWGERVYSPLIGNGEADVCIAFEQVEALRGLNLLRRDALVLVNMEAIEPLTVTSGGQAYPAEAHVRETVHKATSNAHFIPASALAQEVGNSRTANVVLLGALSTLLEPSTGLTAEQWLEVIIERVPQKFAEINKQAFMKGRDAVA